MPEFSKNLLVVTFCGVAIFIVLKYMTVEILLYGFAGIILLAFLLFVIVYYKRGMYLATTTPSITTEPYSPIE